MKTKINILSHGRFHMLDLARELEKQGFDVQFYSFVPPKRCKQFGLSSKACKSLFIYLLPFLFLEKKVSLFKNTRRIFQDYIMGIFMRKCDIVISLTGFVFAPQKAQEKGAIFICERGSKHILEQQRILNLNPNKNSSNTIPEFNIKQNLEAYKLANYISVASQHVINSFLLHGFPQKKLFKNPYGVDLKMFAPQPQIEKKYDFIMVGGWGYRKGCDLIIEAIRKTNYTFLHVGGIVDLDFPQEDRFTHVDAVDQSQLINYYNQAKIFLLPSREDGFGMVLSQALACNLPIIGSKDCGAPDLQQMVEDSQYITLIEDYTPEALIKAMNRAMENYPNLKDKTYAGHAIENLTWEAYGKRYADFLHSIIKK